MTTTPLAVDWGDDGVCRATLMRPGAGNSLSAGSYAFLRLEMPYAFLMPGTPHCARTAL